MESKETAQNKPRSLLDKLVYVGLAMLVIGVLAALVVPNRGIHGDRSTSPKFACISNLRKIDAAKQIWAMEHQMKADAVPTWADIKLYLEHGTSKALPKCPSGGVYTVGPLTNAPTCTINGHVLE